MHREDLDVASPGDVVGIRVSGLNPANKPKRGDCMVLASDSSLKVCRSFKARVSVMSDVPGDIFRGYTPVAFSRTGRACCRMTQILWKVGPSTGHVRVQDPEHFEKNDVGGPLGPLFPRLPLSFSPTFHPYIYIHPLRPPTLESQALYPPVWISKSNACIPKLQTPSPKPQTF